MTRRGARRGTVEVRRVMRARSVAVDVDAEVVPVRARQVGRVVRVRATPAVYVPVVGRHVAARQVDGVVGVRRRAVQVPVVTVDLGLGLVRV